MKFQIFLTTQAQHMWRLLAANGLTIATSGESYVQKHDCLHGIGLVMGTTSVSQYHPVPGHRGRMALATGGDERPDHRRFV